MTTAEGSRPAVAVPPDIQGFRRSVAVLIGVDAYVGEIPALKSAANDATHLAQLLTEQHHYDEVRLLTNEQASCAALRKLLDGELAELVGDDGQARLLFYFAGHGLAAESNDGRPAGYLVPQDASRDIASMLPMADLLEALDRLTCRHLLLVLDCCFAGAIRWSGTRSLIAPRAKLYRERYLRYLQGRAWQVLTSAAADERASDFVSFGERASATDEGHSPFALALYDGLAGHADLPFDAPYGDGVITARDLAEYLNEQVTLHAIDQQRSQTPQIWEMPRHGKGEYVFLVPGTQSLDLPPTPYSNPYRGLEPFDEAHSDFFFGREELAEMLAEQMQDLPLMVLAGASGVGKSSLLRAGLLPLLRAKAEPSYEILPTVSFSYTPAKLFADLPLPPATPATLSARVGAWAAANPDKKLVLPLDEFERLVRWPEDQRKRVLDELAGALEAHAERLRVVLTVRAADQAAFGDGPLKPFWSQGRFDVKPIREDELRQAIVEPAAKCVMFFEPEKQIEWIYDATCNAPGGLALLSLTLRQLYQHAIERNADDREITKDDFDAVGGVRGAVLTHASTVYDELNEAQRSTARRVLLRLVQVDGSTTTPRTISLNELQFPKPADTEQAMRVLRQLADARLVVIGARQDGVGTVELAHQALFNDWDKLNAWVEPERPALDLRRQLGEANADWMALQSTAHTWRQRRKAMRRLWTDDRLEQAASVLRSPRSWLNVAEQRFVEASLDRERRQQWRSRIILIATAAVMTVLALVALIMAVVAGEALQEAKHRALVAGAQSQLEQGNTGEALALALAAVAQPDHLPESEAVLSEAAALGARRRFIGHQSEVLSVAYNPDGKTIASGDGNGTLRLWDTTSGETLHIFTGHSDAINGVAFSPDGKMLLSGSFDQTVRLWDVASGRELRQFQGEPGYVTSVAFSPDGKTAVSSGYDGELILWNVDDGRKVTQFDEPGEVLYSAVFSPDGKTILVASADGRLRLWDVASEQLIRTFTGHQGEVNNAAFSPDGGSIISGSDDHTLRLWDVASGTERGRFIGHDDWVWSAAFSPDGHTIVSSSRDQTVRLWDVATRRELRRFEGHQSYVNSLAFSPDGKSLITGSQDQTVRLWDVAPGQELWQVAVPNRAIVQSIAFMPDGLTAVTSADDGTLNIWDAPTGQLIRSSPMTDDPSTIAYSIVMPDGGEAYSYTYDGELSKWDVPGETKTTQSLNLEDENAALSPIAISPDGQQILYTSYISTTAVLYRNLATGETRQMEGHTAEVISLAFSSDGKTALTGSLDRTIRLWDIATGQTIKVFTGHTRSVTSVGFSHDGKTIVSGSNDHTIRLWDAETGQVRARLFGHSGAITSVALSPDGHSVLSGSDDGTLRLWRVETPDELTTWIRANRDVPALPCNVGEDFGLDVPPNCVGTTAPESPPAQ